MKMKMQEARERFLVEQMGVVYNHCSDHYIFTTQGMWTEWEYFGRLWVWANEQKWWGKIKLTLIAEEGDGTFGPLYWPIDETYINPEMFAIAVYSHLKGVK